MPEIRPVRNLHDINVIFKLCHIMSEPVYINKNSYQDLVIMSNAEFERRCGREEIYAKLLEAESNVPRGQLLDDGDVFYAMRVKYEY